MANSWQTNRNQNGTQVYYYLNNYHDWLQNNSDIGFGPAQGNFQVSNGAQGGQGNDAVQAQVDDGANTAGNGFPDQNHVDNANMGTQQDGIPPRMQMYLFPYGGISANGPDMNGGDEADVVYHEYTHGLSNRLVTYSNGVPALGAIQSRMMGEAWSDWYAMDYLNVKGYDSDDIGTIGDVAGRLLRQRRLDDPQRADGLPRRRHLPHLLHRRQHRACRWLHLRRHVEGHRPGPRSTPTVRSGARRCGRSVRTSAPPPPRS